MSKEAMKLALELKNSASAYWTEKEIPIIEKLIKLLALAEQPAQQELPACISCGAAPTRYVDEGTDFPGTYCDHCGPGGVPSQQEPDYKALYEKAVEQYNELADLMAEQPAQQEPFGVGGGLVAIKTLLSRDPCVHANTAIEMIDAILAEQPAPMIRGDIRDGLVDDEPAQSSKPFDTHAAPGQSFDTHSRTLQQEPVAWISEVRCVGPEYGKKRYGALPVQSLQPGYYAHTPLYTSPPAQRTWVGLTDEDIEIAFDDTQEGGGFDDFARAIEAKLKEKNT